MVHADHGDARDQERNPGNDRQEQTEDAGRDEREPEADADSAPHEALLPKKRPFAVIPQKVSIREGGDALRWRAGSRWRATVLTTTPDLWGDLLPL